MLIAECVKVFSQTGTQPFLFALRFFHFVGLTLLPKHEVGLGANFTARVASRQTKMKTKLSRGVRQRGTQDMLVRNTKGSCAKSSPRLRPCQAKGFREGPSHE